MCSGSEAGSYLRLIDFVYHTTLGLRVIKKKRRYPGARAAMRLQARKKSGEYLMGLYRGTSPIGNRAPRIIQ